MIGSEVNMGVPGEEDEDSSNVPSYKQKEANGPPPIARYRQWIAAFLANLAAVCGGTALSWSAPALPALQGDATDGGWGAWAGPWTELLLPAQPLTVAQGALVASLVPLGAVAGALPAGWVARRMGCRRPLLALAAIFSVGWSLVSFSGKLGLSALLLGRVLHGVATGAATVLVARYCDEVAEVAVRGAVGALLDLSLCNGALLVYALALAFPYALLTLACACVPLIFSLTFYYMPESPVFLERSGQHEEALIALAWLRPGWEPRALASELGKLTAQGPSSEDMALEESPLPAYDDVVDRVPDYEMVAIPPSQTQLMSDTVAGNEDTTLDQCGSAEEQRQLAMGMDRAPSEAVKPSWGYSMIQRTAALSTSTKAAIIVNVLMFLQQAAAISAVMAYATQMFEEAGSALSPTVCTVVLGALQSAGGAVAALAVERAGRRPLLVGSAAAAAVALVAMASVNAATAAPWLPPVALGAYIFAFEIGIGPLPWFITAELVGPTAGGVAAAVNWGTAAAVTHLYPGAQERFGQRVVFAAFAAMAGFAAVFSWTCVPETRGKTRSQLHRDLQRWPRRRERAQEADIE